MRPLLRSRTRDLGVVVVAGARSEPIVKITRLAARQKVGQRCVRSPLLASTFVSGSIFPPRAETRLRPAA